MPVISYPGAKAPLQIIEGNGLELLYDPDSKDLIPSPDGWFYESADSRSTVAWEMDCIENAWWGDSKAGSQLKTMLEQLEAALEPEEVRDEILRILAKLVQARLLETPHVIIEYVRTDMGSIPIFLINYVDKRSGRPVELAWAQIGI